MKKCVISLKQKPLVSKSSYLWFIWFTFSYTFNHFLKFVKDYLISYITTLVNNHDEIVYYLIIVFLTVLVFIDLCIHLLVTLTYSYSHEENNSSFTITFSILLNKFLDLSICLLRPSSAALLFSVNLQNLNIKCVLVQFSFLLLFRMSVMH